jgi:tripartite-type tricarboxylate transporter receptor subunit TctC
MLLALALGAPVLAQDYPTHPVRLVVPFGPGAPDTVARVVGQQMAVQMGQPFVVENRLGANGVIGTDVVAKAPADGYTLLVVSASFVVNPSIYRKLPFDPLQDFAPVSNLCSQAAFVLAVNPAVPAQTAGEFIAWARQHAGEVAYGSPGIGNTIHLAGALFDARAGTHMVHVPYKGGGAATAALLSGEIQMMMSNELLTLPYLASGKLRALAVTSHERLASMPQVPTLAEAGVPGMEIDAGWFALFAPARTPPEIVLRLQQEARKALEVTSVRERLAAQGLTPVGNTPAEFKAYVQAQLPFYAEMVRIAGVQPE